MWRVFDRGRNVQRLEKRGDVTGLRSALARRDPVQTRTGQVHDLEVSTRVATVQALSRFDDEDADAGLAEALADVAPEVRTEAAIVLSERDRPVAVDPLLWGVVNWDDDAYGDACERAVGALERWAVPMLPERFALTCADRSGPIDTQPHGEWFSRLLDVDERGPDEASRDVTRMLLRRFPDEFPTNVLTVLSWLAPRCTEVLLDGLAHRGGDVPIVELIGSTKDPVAVTPLRDVLERNADPDMRTAAAWALGQIRDPEAIPSLMTAAKDEAFQVRTTAGAALDAFGALGVVMGVAAAVREAGAELPANSRQELASRAGGDGTVPHSVPEDGVGVPRGFARFLKSR